MILECSAPALGMRLERTTANRQISVHARTLVHFTGENNVPRGALPCPLRLSFFDCHFLTIIFVSIFVRVMLAENRTYSFHTNPANEHVSTRNS